MVFTTVLFGYRKKEVEARIAGLLQEIRQLERQSRSQAEELQKAQLQCRHLQAQLDVQQEIAKALANGKAEAVHP